MTVFISEGVKMWFEILPSAIIIYAVFNIPTIGMYAMHRFFLNNPYRRDLRYQVNRVTYLRDRRLMDNPYKFNGLETINDDDDDDEDDLEHSHCYHYED